MKGQRNIMKKIMIGVLAMLSALSVLAMSVAASGGALTNGGFEGTDIGNVYANDGATLLTISEEQKYSGKSSLKNSGRTNNYGALAVNVTDYINKHGAGEFYCTFRIFGTSDASVRATLHTTYENGGDFYRQVGLLTEFKKDKWTLVGCGEDGKALPLRIENWDEQDITKWNPTVEAGVKDAVLYLWVEGDTTSDFYIDELNFWGAGDKPIDYSPKTSDDLSLMAVVVISAISLLAVSNHRKQIT